MLRCILLSPPAKEQFKTLIKCLVMNYWETTLREESALLSLLSNAKQPTGRHLSRHHRPFWGHLAAILDFVGSAVLQTVRRCRQ